jgi:5-methylcytosine-specific restriction endonuclease McrA
MRKFVRRATPAVLEENGARWGEEYAAKRITDPGHQFRWPQVNNRRLNQILLPDLKTQTDDHCSYCDKFPLTRGDESIDHSRPKTDERFYGEVCLWNNLYLACKHCQDSKLAQFSDYLNKA